MRTPRRHAWIRLACILIVVSALAAACGGDNEEKTSPTVRFTPSTGAAATTIAPTTPVTSAPGAVVQGVTDGAACSPEGARGVTQGGANMICTLVGTELRWRPS